MELVKGVVLRKESNRVLIELHTGHVVWATPNFKLALREEVLLSYDHTHSYIREITTQERLDTKAETEVSEGFSLPLVERAEAEVEDEAEVEAEVFSPPEGERADAEAEVDQSDDNFDLDEAQMQHDIGDERDIGSIHRHNINSLLL